MSSRGSPSPSANTKRFAYCQIMTATPAPSASSHPATNPATAACPAAPDAATAPSPLATGPAAPRRPAAGRRHAPALAAPGTPSPSWASPASAPSPVARRDHTPGPGASDLWPTVATAATTVAPRPYVGPHADSGPAGPPATDSTPDRWPARRPPLAQYLPSRQRFAAPTMATYRATTGSTAN